DQRLINHGSRVAYIFSAMLITRGGYSARELRDYYTLALFHDIGAYKTDEIDRMMQFETGDVWQHSVYGYLFLKGFSP
ncbi:MAG: phosphohydrolase, partial [Ruthenibacterium sp.]